MKPKALLDPLTITQEQSTAKSPKNYAKLLFFAILGLMILVVTYNKILFYGSEVPSAFRTQMLSMKEVLIPHIVFSMVGLLVGPIQFSSRFRARNLHLHRLLGRIYGVSILLGGILALVITFLSYPLNDSFAIQGLVQAGSWLLTTTIAWVAARNRQITLHKIWMARSYEVTFIAVASRFLNLPVSLCPKRTSFCPKPDSVISSGSGILYCSVPIIEGLSLN